MKKIWIALVLAVILLCCACSASPESTATAGTEKTQAPLSAVTLPETGGIEVGVFSFESAMAYYAALDGEAIVREGFVNTEPVTVATAEEALEILQQIGHIELVLLACHVILPCPAGNPCVPAMPQRPAS